MASSMLLIGTGAITFRQFALERYLISLRSRQWTTSMERLARVTERPAAELYDDIDQLLKNKVIDRDTIDAVIDEE